jgi:uracil-DNA glycosylase
MTKKEEQIRLLIGGSWYKQLHQEFDSAYMKKINKFLGENKYYPETHNIFRAFMLCGFDNTKIVILGQDPYHDGQANGLAFSTQGKMNPSLRMILDGINEDAQFGSYLEHQHNLSYLCDRGVLLMNTALTVSPGEPESHLELWAPFTRAVLSKLNAKDTPIVFLLWGKKAQYYKKYIDPMKHTILEAEHPAYAARMHRPWEHNNCFSEAVNFVEQHYGDRYTRIW